MAVGENAWKVRINFLLWPKFIQNCPLVVIETPRRLTETLVFSNFFSERDGRTAEKMIAFGQEKSGKSKEISKVRSCGNPRKAHSPHLCYFSLIWLSVFGTRCVRSMGSRSVFLLGRYRRQYALLPSKSKVLFRSYTEKSSWRTHLWSHVKLCDLVSLGWKSWAQIPSIFFLVDSSHSWSINATK